MIVNPKRPSFARWRKLSSTHLSLLRSLEYECIEGLSFSGVILDMGGGATNSYYHLMRLDEVVSINLNKNIHPDVIGNLDHRLPFADGCFEHVICFNTVEHLCNDGMAIEEMLRVVRPGGGFTILVPFLYPVHGSPYDYHRHTAQWWEAYLCRCGIKSEQFIIEPLAWDRLAAAFSMVEFAPLRSVRKMLAMLWAVIRPSNSHVNQADFALGYFIRGTLATTVD